MKEKLTQTVQKKLHLELGRDATVTRHRLQIQPAFYRMENFRGHRI